MDMTIEQQFNDIAKRYDENRRKFIPCFDEFYSGTTRFIASSIKTPTKILDLGAGTGLLSSFWLENFSTARYTLVDIADEMLDVAKERFSGLDNFSFSVKDYIRDFDSIVSCCKPDAIISALSVHHLENEDKAKLFQKVYDTLDFGNVFVNYDQFCADEKCIDKLYSNYWENQVVCSSLTDEDIRKWRSRQTLDRECSVREELEMLKDSGFESSECVFKSQKFAVILCIK